MGWLKGNQPKCEINDLAHAQKLIEQFRTVPGVFDYEEERLFGEALGYESGYLTRSREQSAEVVEMVAALGDAERLMLFRMYCRSCGSNNPKCQCWRDE